MIRFINLKGQIYLDENQLSFAFFDTVIDKFCEFSGSQNWDSVEEFTVDYDGDEIERFLNLIPDVYKIDFLQFTREMVENPSSIKEISKTLAKAIKIIYQLGPEQKTR